LLAPKFFMPWHEVRTLVAENSFVVISGNVSL
jgi:hypothetical protein